MPNASHHRYQVLDSLRGICACMVVLYHFHTVGWISNLALVRNSWLFVDFFFVLSGFVIASAYRRRIAEGFPVGSFMWLRMGRIYPVHLFVTGLFVSVQFALLWKAGSAKAFQGNMSLPDLIASLTLTQAFVLPNGIVWNGPSWSIAVEMWTYLLFAAMFRVLGSRNSLAVACAIVAGVSCVYIAKSQGFYMYAFHFGAFFRCTYGFALGVIGAEFYPMLRGWTISGKQFSSNWVSAGSAIELAAAGLVGVVISVVGRGPFSMLAPPMFLAVILIFAGERGVLSSGLKRSFPLLLGELSYSIYMIHLFVLFRVDTAIELINKQHSHAFLTCGKDYSCSASGSPLLADALIVPVLAAVIGAAYLLRNYVEAPCERWAKQALSRRGRSIRSYNAADHKENPPVAPQEVAR